MEYDIGLALERCVAAVHRRENINRVLATVTDIIHQLAKATSELQAKLTSIGIPERHPIGFDALKKLQGEVRITSINRTKPDPELMESIKREVEVMIEVYLEKGIWGKAEKYYNAIKDGIGSLFGGTSPVKKREIRMQEGLCVFHKAKEYFNFLREEWYALLTTANVDLNSLTDALAGQAKTAMTYAARSLKAECAKELKAASAELQTQIKTTQELKERGRELERDMAQLKTELDAIHTAGITLLQEVAWDNYPGLKQTVAVLTSAKAYSDIEQAIPNLKQDSKAFSELVIKLDNLDPAAEITPILESVISQVSAKLAACEAKSRELNVEADKLCQARQALDAKHHAHQNELEAYAARWEALIGTNADTFASVNLPAAADIYSSAYLAQVQSVLREAAAKLEQMQRLKEKGGDFVKDWQSALANASHIDKQRLISTFTRQCNVIYAPISQIPEPLYAPFDDMDYVIVDEADKAELPELVVPLVFGKTIILVGDNSRQPSFFAEIWNKVPHSMKTVLSQQA